MVRLYPAIGFESEQQYERSDLVFPGEGFEVCETSPEYRRRRPEDSVLYGIVAGHLESFRARQREHGRVVPRFVERELRAFLDCGILARGFLRIHCDACGLDRIVAFSCKCRGYAVHSIFVAYARLAEDATWPIRLPPCGPGISRSAGPAVGALAPFCPSLSPGLRFFPGRRCAADLSSHCLCLHPAKGSHSRIEPSGPLRCGQLHFYNAAAAIAQTSKSTYDFLSESPGMTLSQGGSCRTAACASYRFPAPFPDRVETADFESMSAAVAGSRYFGT